MNYKKRVDCKVYFNFNYYWINRWVRIVLYKCQQDKKKEITFSIHNFIPFLHKFIILYKNYK